MVKVDAANTLRLLSRDRSMTSVVFGGAAARLVTLVTLVTLVSHSQPLWRGVTRRRGGSRLSVQGEPLIVLTREP